MLRDLDTFDRQRLASVVDEGLLVELPQAVGVGYSYFRMLSKRGGDMFVRGLFIILLGAFSLGFVASPASASGHFLFSKRV